MSFLSIRCLALSMSFALITLLSSCGPTVVVESGRPHAHRHYHRHHPHPVVREQIIVR